MVDLRLRNVRVMPIDPVGAGSVDSRYLSSGRFQKCCGVVKIGACDVSAPRGAVLTALKSRSAAVSSVPTCAIFSVRSTGGIGQ